MKKKENRNDFNNIISKNSDFDLNVFEKYNAGLCLSGNEIKSIRAKKVSIKNSFVACKNSEIYIFNMFIKKYENANSFSKENERRPRKLLLKKNEIKKICKSSKEKNLIVIPLKIFISFEKWAKVEIALARKKKLYQIKNEEKEKEIKRKLESWLKKEIN